MTRLTSFLLLEGRTKPLKELEALKIINTKCTDIISYYRKSNFRIYRGLRIHTSADKLIIDPTKGMPRISQNTSNFYTLLLDNLPAWKSYPKRSQSIVCSTEIDKAFLYGQAWGVIPFNTTTIGVCSAFDIWLSFRYVLSGQTLLDFNFTLRNFLNYVISTQDKDSPDIQFDKNWNTLTHAFKQVELIIKNTPERIQGRKLSNLQNEWYKELLQGNTVIEVLDKQLHPKSNGFTIHTPKNLKLTRDREVWVGNGPSILVDPKYIIHRNELSKLTIH